jgi:acyl carrier protein
MEPPALRNDPPLVLRSQLPLAGPYLAPRTATENCLADIWRVALSMDCVGVDDNYFDLGGDSFMATVLFSMIESSFRTSIPVGTLVDAPTIAKLAARVDALRSQATGQTAARNP